MTGAGFRAGGGILFLPLPCYTGLSGALSQFSYRFNGASEVGGGKTGCGYKMRPRGLKPAALLGALRGAEAPLLHGAEAPVFHGAARICEFFRSL
jgi:hypothetical protein